MNSRGMWIAAGIGLSLAGGAWAAAAAPAAGKAPEPASADEEISGEPAPPGPAIKLAGRLMIFGQAGYAGYAMGDLNNYDAENNQYFQYYGVPAPSRLESGLTYGGGLVYWISQHLLIGAEVQELTARESTDNTAIGLTWNVPALEIGGFFKFGGEVWEHVVVTGGIGLYSVGLTQATLDLYKNGTGKPDEHYSVSGAALGFKFMAGAEYFLSDTLSLGFDLGYRVARLREIHLTGNGFNDQVVANSDYTAFSIDYSGPFLQGGVRLYF